MDTHAKRREATTETSHRTGDRRGCSDNQSPRSPRKAGDTPPREAGNTQTTEDPQTRRHHPPSAKRGGPYREVGDARLAEKMGKHDRDATKKTTGHSLEHTIEARLTQAIRRLIEGSVYSPLPVTDRGDRPKRIASVSSNPGRDPGVPVRVEYVDGTACYTIILKI